MLFRSQFLLCRNTSSRYFLHVKLLESFTIMSPPNNSTSKIQKIQQYFSEWDAECVVPYNPEFTANSKHRRTMFAPTSHSGKFLPPQNRSALCGFYSVLEDSKAAQSSPLRLNLYIKIKLEILLSPLCTAW